MCWTTTRYVSEKKDPPIPSDKDMAEALAAAAQRSWAGVVKQARVQLVRYQQAGQPVRPEIKSLERWGIELVGKEFEIIEE